MSQELSEKFQVESPAVIRIDNVRGSVTVRPGPDGEVSIQAVQHGKNDNGSEIEIGQNADGSVFARSEPRRSISLFGDFNGRTRKVDFTVVVPSAAQLTVRTVNASTDVSGISGAVELKTVNGTITVTEVSGDLKFKTVNGEIKGSRVHGAADLTTVSGGISLKEADLPALHANTVSGDILLETPVGAGPYHLKTVSGDTRLVSDGDMHGRIHYRTVSGSVRMNDQRLTSRKATPHKETITLGSGGPDIYFKSVSGNLRMQADSFKESAPAPEQKENPAEPETDFMDILDRISRGELSVDEGIATFES